MPLEVQLEVKILLPPLPQVNSSSTLEYSVLGVFRARCHEMSEFISYSGGAPDFCCPYKKSHKTRLYGGKP